MKTEINGVDLIILLLMNTSAYACGQIGYRIDHDRVYIYSPDTVEFHPTGAIAKFLTDETQFTSWFDYNGESNRVELMIKWNDYRK